MRQAASLALIACLASLAQARDAEWIASWGAAPLPPSEAVGPMPATPSFSNQTIRQVVRLAAGGTQLRIRFTNEYGTHPLRIGAARVALADSSGHAIAGQDRAVTFDGRPSVSIPAGAPELSDPIDLTTGALASLVISIFLPEDTGPCTCHAVGMQNALVSDKGDFTDRDFTPTQTLQSRAFISGVDVAVAGAAKTIVALGDSITDGVGSSPNSNRRWPDLLAERLVARHGRGTWGVANMGISGNRVLNDGAGQSALARLDRDVLAVPGVAYVIVFEGVNDLGISYGHFEGPMAELFRSLASGDKPSAEAMIAAYRQIIARAHARGLKVFGATIAPYEGAFYYSAEGEAVRQAINTWIRSGKAFDAVLDFDAVLRDPAKPTQMAPALHSGDHLHGSDAGYRAVADSIDLSLFK